MTGGMGARSIEAIVGGGSAGAFHALAAILPARPPDFTDVLGVACGSFPGRLESGRTSGMVSR